MFWVGSDLKGHPVWLLLIRAPALPSAPTLSTCNLPGSESQLLQSLFSPGSQHDLHASSSVHLISVILRVAVVINLVDNLVVLLLYLNA